MLIAIQLLALVIMAVCYERQRRGMEYLRNFNETLKIMSHQNRETIARLTDETTKQKSINVYLSEQLAKERKH